MKNNRAESLLQGLPLSLYDTTRLVLETIEEMPELTAVAEQGKLPLMQALRRVLRAGIAATREQEQTIPFRKAAEESLARRLRAGRRPTTLRDLRHFVNRLLRVPGLGERPLRAIGTAECQQALDAVFSGSAHSFRKGRAILHSIFAYGLKRGWCAYNPVSAIDAPRTEERELAPLTLPQCRRLVNVA